VDPSHFLGHVGKRPEGGQRRQGPCGRPQGCRQRLCLLKGCERPFWPKCPQARYCSVVCQRAAERWRKRRSSRTYRASDQGREKRREQARRHRERRREPPLAPVSTEPPMPASSLLAAAESPPSTSSGPAAAPAGAVAAASCAVVASADVFAWRVGQRLAVGCEDFLQRRCARPGCYVWFGVPHDHSSKRFCSVACRLALRRVLDREARYGARRRRWRRERLTRRRRPADTS
jgi:hypothetical protein